MPVLKWAIPGNLIVYFRSFQTNINQISVKFFHLVYGGIVTHDLSTMIILPQPLDHWIGIHSFVTFAFWIICRNLVLITSKDATKAPWFHLCLPSCGPGFESQVNHLYAFLKLYWNCKLYWNVKWAKWNEKMPRLAHILKVDTWLTEFRIDRIHVVLQKGYVLYV